MKKILALGLLTLTSQQLLAADTDAQTSQFKDSNVPKGLYAGGGINYNDLDAGSIFPGVNNEAAWGFQLFAGMPISSSIDGIKTFAEVGYFQTNNFKLAPGVKEKVTGVWGAGVLQKDLNEIDPNLYAIARVGLEIGDDDGIFMGIGAGYRITPKVEIRAEFVNKDLLSSYQTNALIRF
jgi:hypothetical protein